MASAAPAPKPNAPSAQIIFHYADEFAKGAAILMESVRGSGKLPPTVKPNIVGMAKFVPAITLESFATELYLKCLFTLDHGKALHGHKVDELFAKLKPGTQQSVRHFYVEYCRDHPLATLAAKQHPKIQLGLDNYLKLCREVFETIRYFYEEKNTMLFYWPVLSMSLRDTIRAIHPDWGPAKIPYPK